MAITKLPVNFKDDVIDTSISDKRRYNMITNSDGTTSLEDVTTYEQIGSNFGAEQVNQTNGKINEVIDAEEATKSTLDTLNENLDSGEKKVKHSEMADKLSTPRNINGVAFDGTQDITITDVEHAENSDTATNAESASKLSTPRNINGVAFDGTQDITIEDNTKISKNEDFILLSKGTLNFSNNVCNISDSRITEDSLIDVYFTAETIGIASDAGITVDSENGKCVLTAISNPSGTIKASIRVRVV